MAVVAAWGQHKALPCSGLHTWFLRAMASGSSADSGRGLIISCRTSISLLKPVPATTLSRGP